MRMIPDNNTCFTSEALIDFMEKNGIKWKKVLAYAPISNERAERTVGTIKSAIKKTVLPKGSAWEDVIATVLYMYRR